MTIGHPRSRIAFLIILGLPGVSSPCHADNPIRTDHPPACGAVGLYVLFHLEGQQVALSTILDTLPPTPSGGHSMSELRDAAWTLGVNLDGRRLLPGGSQPDRPFLAFLKRDPHGHYIVIRPLGHSGKLAQVLDGPGRPMLMDLSDLFASQGWTGLILVPTRPNWPARIAWGVAGTLILALVAQGLTPYLRRRHSPAPPAVGT